MRVAIVSNMVGGKGLAKDAAIYAERLRELGHEAQAFDFEHDQAAVAGVAGTFNTLLICEVLDKIDAFVPLLAERGRVWYMVNPEWELPAKQALLHRVDVVLCKTDDALRCAPWHGKARHLGFESEDLGRPGFDQPPVFLHPAGGSGCRGTVAVLEAWRGALTGGLPAEARLVVIDPPILGAMRRILRSCPSVTVHERMDDARFRQWQRRSAVHVLGSEYEGWGHLFWEALSLGARVLGTDGPWWAAARGGFDPIPARPGGVRHLGREHHIDACALAPMLVAAARDPGTPRAAGRRAFEVARAEFRARFAEFVKEEACRI